MRDWFELLEARERLFVAMAAGVLVLAVFWLAVWMPLDRGQQDRAASVDQWSQSLAELRMLKGRIGSGEATSGTPADANRSLVLIVDSTLREHGLYSALQRSQPGAGNDIRIELRDAPFDDMVLWLGDVSSRYGLQVQTASFLAASDESNGRVNSTVTLER